ncbi:MAG: hypothetical protein E7480_08385 [Ruminococcaceae bacterium]|nr:hypothetical protein [Oscillospiraceae bacterium]
MRKRSIFLIIATILATAYSIYLFCYFVGGTVSSSGTEAIGGAIATVLVAPHAIMFFIGAIFGFIGCFAKKSWAALVAAILYSVGTLFFLAYIMFGAPILILGFIGYANQRKINKKVLVSTNIGE